MSAFANGGIAVKAGSGTSAAEVATSGNGTVGVDLATFQTSGFLTKANYPSTGIVTVDALGASSAAIDAFALNHNGAATLSLTNVSLTAAQYTVLVGNGPSSSATTNYLKVGGVLSLDASLATTAEVSAIVADTNATSGSNSISSFADRSISNIDLTSAQFGAQASGTTIVYAKLASGGADIDADLATAGGTGTSGQSTTEALMALVTANSSKVGNVFNVNLDAGNLNDANFALFSQEIAADGIQSVNNGAGTLYRITVTSGGAGYGGNSPSATGSAGTVAATVAGISGSATVGATASYNVSGVVTSVTVPTGTGYTAAPSITIAGTSGGTAATASSTLNPSVFSADNWNTLVANSSKILDGSIGDVTTLNATNLTVDKFLLLKNEFAVGRVGQTGGKGLDLYGASSTQISEVIANLGKLTSDTVENAAVTAAQFATFASKIADNQATVNASGATADQVTAILNNLGKFDNSVLTDGVAHQVSNLTITGAQFNSLSSLTALKEATPVGAVGALFINDANGATAVSVDANGFTNALTAWGSNVGDTYKVYGASTIQGATGADRLDASAITDNTIAVSLSGGNAADTIIGGAGNDTINGGKAGAAGGANYLTGGAGADTFNMALNNPTSGDVSVNIVTDLGNGANKFTVGTGAVATAYFDGTNQSFTAAAGGAVNNGTMTIKNSAYTVSTKTEATNSAAFTVNLANATGTSAFSIVGGTGDDTVTGSSLADTISGGSGNDSITGGAGADLISGGLGTDTFVVGGSATDTITDLGLGGVDILSVSAGGSVNANVTVSWTASSSTVNSGTATMTLGNAVGINLDSIISGNGFTINATGNTAGSNIVGSLSADTINGGGGADTIAGLEGIDTITLAVDNQTDVVVLNTTGLTADRDVVTNFIAGIGGDMLQATATLYDAYNANKVEVLATVNTLSQLANGGANSAVAGVNYIVADTSANILSANLAAKFADGSNPPATKAAMAYATDTGAVYYDADGNFSSGAVLVAQVTSTGTWVAGNFDIV